MAAGTIRYWAAAKAAAGTAEEPYAAETLAEALDAARERHPGSWPGCCGGAPSWWTAPPWERAGTRRYGWRRAAR